MTKKTKNQKNLDVGLSGFIGSKGNSDVASKIRAKTSFVLTTAVKDSKKMSKKINSLFYHNRHQ